MDWDALILAGGEGRRLGGVDKAGLTRGDVSLLRAVLDGCAAASRRVVVGPARDGYPDAVWCREDPPGGGPLAGVAAGLERVTAPAVVVLAVDQPHAPRAIPALLDALRAGAGCAVLVAAGRRQPLVSAHRTTELARRLRGLGDPSGRPARLVLADDPVEVRDLWQAAADVDTPEQAGRLGWELP